jgi:hypothetical protein
MSLAQQNHATAAPVFKRLCDLLLGVRPSLVCPQMLDYNVPLGKLNRGMAVVDVARALAQSKGGDLSDDQAFQAAALGWCIEFLQVRGRAGWSTLRHC